MTKTTIALSVIEGRVVRDLFENGFLDFLANENIDVVLYTPAATVPSFVKKWQPYVKAIEYHPLYTLTAKEQRLLKVRNFIKDKVPFAIDMWMQLEHKLYKGSLNEIASLKKHGCSTVVITHPSHSFEMPIYKAARKLKLPVIGVLRSWDNIYKGLRLRPDHLTVWNPINKSEALDVMKLDTKQVHITGGSQFDPYFSDEVKSTTKEQFCKDFNLNPNYPIIMIATLGAFIHAYDEHYLIDHLIECIENKELPDGTQLLIRLHPTTKLEYMQQYEKYPFIRLSYISGYIPTIGWSMTLDEMKEVGKMLKHVDAVVSPGSTITIETAIYSTPTIVPVFHHYQPESGVSIFNYHFKTHFKRLQQENLVPFVYKKEDLAGAINDALQYPEKYTNQSQKLANDYIHLFDGKSTERIAKTIKQLIDEKS